MKRFLFYLLALGILAPALCCGSSPQVFNPSPGVQILPLTADVVVGQSQQFTATLLNDSSGVIWSVDGAPVFGTVDANGLYTAPAVVPPGGTAVVRAALVDNNQTQGTAEVTVLDAPPGP